MEDSLDTNADQPSPHRIDAQWKGIVRFGFGEQPLSSELHGWRLGSSDGHDHNAKPAIRHVL